MKSTFAWLAGSLSLVLACGGDDGGEAADEASDSSSDSNDSSEGPTTGSEDPTTDPSTTDAETTDPSTTDAETTDPSTTDAETTDPSTTDTTTDTMGDPVCGDGNVDPGEACDDGNMVDGDGCSNACEWASRIAFITSSTHDGGELGGLAGADAICNTLASAADLPGTYMAWLSTAEGSPATRFVHSTVPYVTVSGNKVADDWADLTDGSLDVIVGTTETGGPVPNADYSCNGTMRQSWTGTNADGTPATNHCNGFTSTAATGAIGRNTSTMQWSVCNPSATCAVVAPIYCFQQ